MQELPTAYKPVRPYRLPLCGRLGHVPALHWLFRLSWRVLAYAYRTVSGNRSSAQIEYRNVRNSAGTLLEGKKYTYDALGNITMISQSTGSYYPLVAYEYDAQNQLVKETYYNGNGTGSSNVTATYTYTYDTAGNILSETKTVNSTTSTKTYTYGNSQWNDLLTSVNGESISYDDAGNPTSYSRGNGTPYNMSWVNGRQLSYMFCYEEQWQVAYTYDAEGNRTTKNDDGTRHTYVTQNGKVVRETIGSGSTAKVLDFIYDESGSPFALKYSTNGGSSFTTYYYVLNLQGDVVKLVNANGTAYATYTYNAWGEVLTATGSMASINPLRYRGYYYDTETGFYYLQSRYYDPVTHRFINADAPKYSAMSAYGLNNSNLFAYCQNNPVAYADENGEWIHLLIGAVVGAAVGAISAAIQGKSGEEIAIAAATGAASGLLTASGAGVVAQVVGGAAISATESCLAQGVSKGFDNIDYSEVLCDAAIGGVSGLSGSIGKGTSRHLMRMGNNATKHVASRLVNDGLKSAGKEFVKAGKYYISQTAALYYKPVLKSAFKSIVNTAGANAVHSFVIKAS